MKGKNDNQDDQLVQHFLQSHREEIVDAGFTQRVIRQLPGQTPKTFPRTALWWSNLLTALTTFLCLLLFFRFNGLEQLWNAWEYIFKTKANEWICNGSLPTLLGSAFLCLILGVSRTFHYKE